MGTDHTMAVFTAELIALLLCGRLLGEALSRLGQPALFGQLLAGVLLGPSVFGLLLPAWHHALFPQTPTLKHMIDAVSQIGILLLLLLTGMETNLSLVADRRRAVISTSLAGIALPFAGGLLLAYAMPDGVVPAGKARLVTALFLGTALSISSVKIVAMVLMEIGAIRRDIGQLILATAILDDSFAWIIIAVISGIAAHGAVDLAGVGASIAGTALFLAASLTVGRRLVARLIVWANDHLTIEMPVITAILLVMLAMSFTTEMIGVHTALGAFVAGVLIGHSPILTSHIEETLRGFIVAFFSPVFFAVAGLGMDIRTLMDPALLVLTGGVVLVASLGKFAGALLGGRLGGLTMRESVVLATGLNARGSTEVIVASIGLAMGALGNQLYTMIVAMAVVTTMVMPPTLRWVMARLPLGEDEARRLDREAAEEAQDLPRMERALVLVDGSANGRMAARLAGLIAGQQQMATTVLQQGEIANLRTLVAAARASREQPSEADRLVVARPAHEENALEREIERGYDIAFAGVERPIAVGSPQFEAPLQRLVTAFSGPVVIALNGVEAASPAELSPMEILLPTSGSPDARLATEIAISLASASQGRVTALHVFAPQESNDLLRGRARRPGMSVLVDAHRLGRQRGVPVRGLTATNPEPQTEIRRAARRGRYDLIVLGISLRQGEAKFLGPHSAALARSLHTPLLLIAR